MKQQDLWKIVTLELINRQKEGLFVYIVEILT